MRRDLCAGPSARCSAPHHARPSKALYLDLVDVELFVLTLHLLRRRLHHVDLSAGCTDGARACLQTIAVRLRACAGPRLNRRADDATDRLQRRDEVLLRDVGLFQVERLLHELIPLPLVPAAETPRPRPRTRTRTPALRNRPRIAAAPARRAPPPRLVGVHFLLLEQAKRALLVAVLSGVPSPGRRRRSRAIPVGVAMCALAGARACGAPWRGLPACGSSGRAASSDHPRAAQS